MNKKIFLVLSFLLYGILVRAQVVSSGKTSIHINNRLVFRQSDSILAAPVDPASQTDKKSAQPEIKGKFFALIIGINNYMDPKISSLDRPVKDAETFYNTLVSKYTFDAENVRLLRNATYSDIVDAFEYFSKIVDTQDNFLVFYAGHGYWDEASGLGYWLPSDAKKSSKAAWFRNSALRESLKEIKSRHTLLISDACFAGSIFKTRSAFYDYDFAINKLYELPSRKAMTSGTLEEVPDQSEFLRYLTDRLIKNKENYLSSEQLYSSFRLAVINNSKAVPQFGVIQELGDEGGDFIFKLR